MDIVAKISHEIMFYHHYTGILPFIDYHIDNEGERQTDKQTNVDMHLANG